jgi:hypothetical protein
MVSAITASPARTHNASIGQRESERTVTKRIRRSSVVNAESPTRRSKGWPLGTRSGCVGLPPHAHAATTATMKNARMRKQYYFRPSPAGLQAWDVDRLIALTKDLPRREVALEELGELDRPWSGDGEHQTWRELVAHVRLIEQADLSFPIILAANGEVMDGRHRIAKAALAGRATITAVQFTEDPPPDYVGRGPDDLPY